VDAQGRRRYTANMKVMLIYNPAAGLRDAHQDVLQTADMLAWRGARVTIAHTSAPGDATRLAAQAVSEGYDQVVAAGGDGTLGEVATGLAGSECILGVLPVGTGNLWARNLRIPHWTPSSRTALRDAARVLLEGEVRAMDLGCVAQRRFALHLGVGFDALVAQAVEPTRHEKARGLRNLRYWRAVLGLALSRRGARMTITIDGATMRERALVVVVSNAQYYGGSYCLAPAARLDDGLLDVTIFKGTDGWDTMRHIGAVMAGHHVGSPGIEAYQARHVEVRPDEPLPVQMDGDPVDRTPVNVRVDPGALRVIVPPAAAELFCRPPIERVLVRGAPG